MSSYGHRSLKRKIEDCQDAEDSGGRAAKEARGDELSDESVVLPNALTLQRILPADLAFTDVIEPQYYEEEIPVEACRGRGSVSRGTFWTGGTGRQQIHESSSQVFFTCKRFHNGLHAECETQTYHFVPEPVVAADEISSPSYLSFKNYKVIVEKDKDNSARYCCVRDCSSQSSEKDSSIKFYALPSSKAEKLLWADILGVDILDAPADTVQEICCQHFITPSISPVPKSAQASKSRTRKKRTCDILIAEEAEKVKQSMVTGRAKRTPKPNRNYDWAELIPLIKSETDDIEEIEETLPKIPVKVSSTPGRRRKQLLDDIKREEKENELPFMDMDVDFGDEAEIQELETDDYGENISLPSMPRAPPPKPKGRPHRIRDTCTQTDYVCSSKESLREVKVQCNLTAQPFVTCSSCSNIDWMSLEEQLIQCISLIEGDICKPLIANCLKEVLCNVIQPSYASNVLKIISGIERDVLECSKDIVLISSQDDLEEVEIENVIHQEEAPITGVREITPKMWNKKVKIAGEIRIKGEDSGLHDQDSLGLKEATDKDDEEFHPELSALEEDEDDPEEIDDDDDWDIKKEADSGVSITRKKKPRKKLKKEEMLEVGSGQGSSSGMGKEDEVILVSNPASKPLIQQNRRRRRTDGDMRWVRQSHRCPDCDKVFSTRRKYDLHYSHVHLGVPPWQGCHQCDDCGKTFTQKVSLNVHRMFKHGAPRRYQCSKCTYEGPTKEYLKRHMKVHTGERQYVCRECGKGLKTAESYKNHLVLHTNEGRFFCEMCKKAFNHKGAYTDHMRSHQESRDYACNYCGASFKAYKHVARHIRAVHLNDKRFICDICGTQHMTGFNLKNHLKKHGDIPFLHYSYQCPGCEAKFRGFQGLSAHLRVVHNIKSSEIGNEDVTDKPMITPHPTRRPIKYHYSRISSSMLSDDSSGDPKPAKPPETILVECDEYMFCDVKTEEVVYDVCEESFESKQEGDQNFLVADSEGSERVIHIFPCTECSSMFTSETSRQEHMSEAHHDFLSVLNECDTVQS